MVLPAGAGLKMAIKRYNLFPGTLLILVLVVYTLIRYVDSAIAVDGNGTKSIAPIEATVHVDKNEIAIGDKIKFGIRITCKDDIVVQFPELKQQLGVFTVKETGGVEGPKREKEGYFTVERTYVLSSYEIGHQTIPSLKIRYEGAQGEREIVTNEIPVDIKGVLKEEEISGDIKDILPPGVVPTNFRRLVSWICVGLAIFLLSGVVYWLVNAWRKWQKGPTEVNIKRSPHEIAYELLERLLKEDLITKGLIREYYYRITGILRHYIEDRFGLMAPERTTEEFLKEMTHTNKLDTIHKRLVQEFLERGDMVKYARYGPTRTEIQETYDAAKRFIDETSEYLDEKAMVVG